MPAQDKLTSVATRCSLPVQPGDIVAGKYRVDSVVGVGGMGAVVSAHHELLGQRVAMKFMLEEMVQAQTLARFMREARAMARIRSEHVVRIFDVATLDDGMPYMVMEYLSGTNLARRLKNGPMRSDEAVDLLMQALEGVAAAHAAGVVHRDIKPSNIFLATQPGGAVCVKVLDFGISKLVQEASMSLDDDLTDTSSILGSPRYTSPEQLKSSKDVDVRSDIWSLGVVLYEMLAGTAPFSGSSLGEVVTQILTGTRKPLRIIKPEVPEALADVVERCLCQSLDGRYQTVAKLAAALAPFGSQQAADSKQRIVALSADAVASGAVRSDESLSMLGVGETESLADAASGVRVALTPTGATGERAERKRWKSVSLIVIAGAVMLAAALGLFFLVERRGLDVEAMDGANAEAVPTPVAPSVESSKAPAHTEAPSASSHSPSPSPLANSPPSAASVKRAPARLPPKRKPAPRKGTDDILAGSH